jgi:cellulose 1,4-beta-cellobiosidase
MKSMGESMKRGMVLVLSLWDDHEAYMLWLDSDYPLDLDPSKPGVKRGPCARNSGKPWDVESQYPNASVEYFNIKFGTIGSTIQFESDGVTVK